MFRRRNDSQQPEGTTPTKLGRLRAVPRRYKVIALLFGAALIGASAGTYASWNANTSNAGNSITAGTVGLSNNSGGQNLFTLTNWAPGSGATSCIQIENTGNLTSLAGFGGYLASGSEAVRNATAVVVTRGTFPNPSSPPTFPSCTGFTPDATNYKGLGAGIMYYTTLNNLPLAVDANALEPTPSDPEVWSPGEKHVYQIIIGLSSTAAAQGLSMDYRFTWGAVNQ